MSKGYLCFSHLPLLHTPREGDKRRLWEDKKCPLYFLYVARAPAYGTRQKGLERSWLDRLCSEDCCCWQPSEMMQPRLRRAAQTRLFIKAKGKMKGQGELEWPVWRGRFKVGANSSGLYGDKGKIMSTENSPWEKITESSIRFAYCCFWLTQCCSLCQDDMYWVFTITRAHLEPPVNPDLNYIPSSLL